MPVALPQHTGVFVMIIGARHKLIRNAPSVVSGTLLTWKRQIETAVLSGSAERSALALLVIFSFVLRIWGISHLHVWDENVYLLNADRILTGAAPYDEMSSRPPLLPLLFAGAFTLWHHDYAAWIVAVGLNALGPLFLYLGGRGFIGRLPATLAALMLGVSPFMANAFPPGDPSFQGDNTGHSLLTDCPALTIILLAFWLMVRALRVPSALCFFLAGLALAAAGLMRFGSLSSICIIGLLTVFSPPVARSLTACVGGFAIGVSPYLFWSRWRYGGFFYTLRDGWRNFGGPEESAFFYVKRIGFIFSWFAVIGLLVWAVSAISRIWLGENETPLKRNSFAYLPLSSIQRQLYLVLWALALFVFFSTLQHKEMRYIVPAAVPVYLLSGLGWRALLFTRSSLARACGTALMLTAFGACLQTDLKRFRTTFVDHSTNEEMEVSTWIQQHSSPQTVLYAANSFPDFAYYSGLPTVAVPDSGPELYNTLETMPDNSIFIAYKTSDDGSQAVPDTSWFDGHPALQMVHEFEDIRLYRMNRTTVTLPGNRR